MPAQKNPRHGSDNKELANLLIDVLQSTEERFVNEYHDEELCARIRDLPIRYLPGIPEAAVEFYNRPTDLTLSRALTRTLARVFGVSISRQRIVRAVEAFVRLFQQELAISNPQMREKLIAIANLRASDSTSQPRIAFDYIMGDKIQISNSVIGMLNSGVIKDVEQISFNVLSLESSGKTDVAKAIREITEAIANETEISQFQRKETLEQLQELSNQALRPSEKRSAPGVIKAIISSLEAAIGTKAGIAQVWSTWETTISKFFGI